MESSVHSVSSEKEASAEYSIINEEKTGTVLLYDCLGEVTLDPVHFITAMLIDHDTVFFSHNKTASAGL